MLYLNLIHKLKQNNEDVPVNDIAASFQFCVCDVLASRLIEVAKEEGVGDVCLAGGVAANKGLRTAMQEEMDKIGIKLTVPKFKYCTDNAAMIAAVAYNQFIKENKN